MKKYLITGGAGFIGSNFVHHIYQNDAEACIRVLDKLTYSANLDNLKDFKRKNLCQFQIRLPIH